MVALGRAEKSGYVNGEGEMYLDIVAAVVLRNDGDRVSDQSELVQLF